MSKSSNYWDRRALNRLTEAEKRSEKYIQRVKSIYNKAFRNVDVEISKVYKNYAKETGLDTQKLKELLTRSETKKEMQQLKKQGLDKYVLDNYKSRISRLEQIQAQIYAKIKQIYPKEELINTECYKGVINNSYYKALYDARMGVGFDSSFNKIDANLMNSILNEKWSKKNYSERIWGNTNILADKISEIVGGALLSGQDISRTTRQIKDAFNVGKHYAERLVRTESNHFHNEADAMAYEEMGIKEYIFMATLDTRTSIMCQANDHKKYKYSEREVGVNYPPLHPNCRSTTRGYIDDEAEKMLKRNSVNPITGKKETINNLNYNQWMKKHNLTKVNNGIVTNKYNIKYNTKSLNSLDSKLLTANTDQLTNLFDKFPKVAEFIKINGLNFGARNMNAIASTHHNYDMSRLGINLSNNYYNNYNKYNDVVTKGVNDKWFMPCSKNNVIKYALNHEFGHLVENHLINEYNLKNPAEYNNYKTRIKMASNQSQINNINKLYENKICDKIAQDIQNIAIKDNNNFVLNDNLSMYGRESSQEFFAECFANMIGGKPNQLGKAMQEYLKGVM